MDGNIGSVSSRLQVLKLTEEDRNIQTFVFHGEDHTLGNALRYIISKNPDVKFCSYTVPHPSENKIHFRIETTGSDASDILKKGLNDLAQLCQHVITTFEDAVESYNAERESLVS